MCTSPISYETMKELHSNLNRANKNFTNDINMSWKGSVLNGECLRMACVCVSECQMSQNGKYSRMANVSNGICLNGNCLHMATVPTGKCPKWQVATGQVSPTGKCPQGNCLRMATVAWQVSDWQVSEGQVSASRNPFHLF